MTTNITHLLIPNFMQIYWVIFIYNQNNKRHFLYYSNLRNNNIK